MNNIAILGSAGKMGRIRQQCLFKLGYTIPMQYLIDPLYDKIRRQMGKEITCEEALNDPRINIIFICTPNMYNKNYTIEALKNGKHVFCEKPPALTVAEVNEVRSYEFGNDQILMYGFNHRHHSSIQEMKKLIDSKEYGKILWMRGRYGKSVDESFYKTWRADPKMSGGGILIDQGIHMLDLMNYFGGPFDEVSAIVDNQFWNLPEIEDNVFAIMRNTKDGISAQLHSTMTQWRHLFSFEVFMEKGYMVLNGLKTSSGLYGTEELSVAINRTEAPEAKWPREINTSFTDDSFLTETKYFMDCIKNGQSPHIGNSDDALSVMKLVEKIYEFKRKN